MNKLALVIALIILIGCSIQPTATLPALDNKIMGELLQSGTDAHSLKLRRLKAETEAHPDNPEIRYQLALAYWDEAEKSDSQESRDQALHHFKQVLALAPDNAVTLQAIYNVHYKNTLRQGEVNISEAKASYRSLPPDIREQLNPPSLALFIHTYIEQSKAEEKHYPQLQQLLLDAINEQPLNQNAYIHLASLYRSQGYYPMALAHLKLASERIPGSAEIYTAIAKTYESRAESSGCSYEHVSQLNSAIEFYKRAIPLDAKNPELHFSLAQLYLDKNQYQLALNETEIILELDPTAENLAFMAQQYSMHNHQKKAKVLLTKARNQGLKVQDSSLHEIYMYAGDWPAAAQAFADYAKSRKSLNAYDAIKADIISRESKRDLLPVIHDKEIHFSSDWEAAVFAFWTEKITRQQLARQAHNRCERTELYFYSGYRNLITGDNLKAKQELTAAIAENTYRFIERPLARHFLEKN